MTVPAPFGERVSEVADRLGPLCVGIDPHPGLLASWGLADDVAGLREFSLRVVQALSGAVGIVKPQAAFFERFGSAGVAVLEEVIAACRAAGLLCIVDAKRGDIGSTMDGYAAAFLTEGSSLAGDAVTVSPYLGTGSLQTTFATARANGRGVFVLTLTSNPEGGQVQHARTAEGAAVAASIARAAAEQNVAERSAGAELGSVGLVVGATTGSAAADLGVDLAGAGGPLLAPGLGAQGAQPENVADVFAGAGRAVLPSSSRGVLAEGPDAGALAAAARSLNAMLRPLRTPAARPAKA
ncbi:MAG TPA: orotidine-5'-phosphate decarboxylase [Candidatus Ruania gallistercoris]|uniref:Orotidine 5'-phosphate decarboxylase n=1 Tax=Candidatus Ruania gallistercoris TaxID=2838746 RepID=A0A9D2EG08_9MICO|nr:orotidine-5'-phosphate decarboxylase [Candidatus Ruania gallistercoris]